MEPRKMVLMNSFVRQQWRRTHRTDLWTRAEAGWKEGVGRMKSTMKTYTTTCKTDSHWICWMFRELKPVL